MNDKPTLTIDEVQAIAEPHTINDLYADDGFCVECRKPWPCPVNTLANALITVLAERNTKTPPSGNSSATLSPA